MLFYPQKSSIILIERLECWYSSPDLVLFVFGLQQSKQVLSAVFEVKKNLESRINVVEREAESFCPDYPTHITQSLSQLNEIALNLHDVVCQMWRKLLPLMKTPGYWQEVHVIGHSMREIGLPEQNWIESLAQIDTLSENESPLIDNEMIKNTEPQSDRYICFANLFFFYLHIVKAN